MAALGRTCLLSLLLAITGLRATEARPVDYVYTVRSAKEALKHKNWHSTAVAFSDGKVGIFVFDEHPCLAIFDPVTETVAYRDHNMGWSRREAIPLPNDKVLFLDGKVSQVYDYSKDAYVATSNQCPPGQVWNRSWVVLPEGRVFICGGVGLSPDKKSTQPISGCATYDPATNRFEPCGEMQQPRTAHTATLLDDNTILIAGGARAPVHSDVHDTFELFDIGQKSSTLLENRMVQARESHAAVRLKDGKVLLVAGNRPQPRAEARTVTAELFDPATGRSVAVGSLAIARWTPSGVLLPSGRVAILGGYDSVRILEIYIPEERRFVLAEQLLTDGSRCDFGLARLQDGRFLIAAGRLNSGAEKLSRLEILQEEAVPRPAEGADDEPPEIKALIAKLGHDEFDQREDASKSLIELGAVAEPYLRKLDQHADLEIRQRAGAILRRLESASEWSVEFFVHDHKVDSISFSDSKEGWLSDPRVHSIQEIIARHKPTHLLVRLPLSLPYETRCRLFNLVGFTRFPIIKLDPSHVDAQFDKKKQAK